ncbi:unnamed protein product [Lota lota]
MTILASVCLVAAALSCLADAQNYQKPAQRPQSLKPNVVPEQHQLPQQPNHIPPKQQQPGKTPFTTESSQSCEVEAAYKIQCGPQDISAPVCGNINCCFDGRMCYYGKAVTVQCTKDAQFIVVVARDATLPNIDLESVSLLGTGPGCTPVGSTSAFAIYQFPVTACGTAMMEEPGVLIYENRMLSSYEVGVGPYGSITRDTTYELLFQCRYIGSTIEALVIEVLLIPPPGPIAVLGPIRVELQLANGVCPFKGCHEEDVVYGSFYTEGDYPVVKILRDPVYVQIQLLERTDPNLVLILGRCWTTSDPNPYSFPQWDLLIDGCPYRDNRYQTALEAVSGVAIPPHYKRFIFKMFTFVDQSTLSPLKQKVFIHCNTVVCVPSAGDNCQPGCFRKRREAGQVTQRDSQNSALVSSMEVQFVSPAQTS